MSSDSVQNPDNCSFAGPLQTETVVRWDAEFLRVVGLGDSASQLASFLLSHIESSNSLTRGEKKSEIVAAKCGSAATKLHYRRSDVDAQHAGEHAIEYEILRQDFFRTWRPDCT